MKISNKDLIKESEGLRLKAYLPTPHDVWTIGWGHTKGVRPWMTITKEQAEQYLTEDLEWVEEVLRTQVKVPLNQNQYDALASFVFNLGGTNFANSTLLRKLNAGDYKGAADEFPKWNKQRQKNGKMVALAGLTKRREEERNLFLEPVQTSRSADLAGAAVVVGAGLAASLDGVSPHVLWVILLPLTYLAYKFFKKRKKSR